MTMATWWGSKLMSSAATTTALLSTATTTSVPYKCPSWAASCFLNYPQHGRLSLSNLPTPLYPVTAPSSSSSSSSSILQRLKEKYNISLWTKRDDMTGGPELGGNKIRKLEFLLADALAQGHDATVTIGGEQSNHCRATAAASRMVGLEPHLILRTRRADDKEPPTTNAKYENADTFGYTGNILFDRMVGSTIYTCTPGEYGRFGSDNLVDEVCQYLKKHGKKPYGIPVGGSNGLGTWGYVNAVQELLDQVNEDINDKNDSFFSHVVFACGSGGTTTGITLGMALSEQTTQVHGVAVCDDPDYFYDYCAGIMDQMGFQPPSVDKDTVVTCLDFIKSHLHIHQGKGLGYAQSTQEEVDFVSQFALETGIVLDPVYTGKALYHFVTHVVENNPDSYRDSNILFWHTGGSLGLFDKGNMLPLTKQSPVKRMKLYGNKDGSNDIV